VSTPVARDLVLVGGGHSHVGVLYRFAMRPLPGLRLTVICTDTDTPYSGMLPGYVAGHYTFDEVHIDLRRLAAFAGARYYRDEVTGIDRSARRVLCRHRPPVDYDALSINIGSTPRLGQIAGEHLIPVKPIRRFNERWLALLERIRHHTAGPLTIAVVGAGAGGVELLLAMQHRLRREIIAQQSGQARETGDLRFHLFSADSRILPTHNRAVRRAFEKILTERGVVVHCGADVSEVGAGALRTRQGEWFAADEVVWVTQAGGAPWLRDTGLALDERGFIRIHASLQSETDPLIFAAGDCASLRERPLEKAGVFAVRMGKPLAENLRRALTGQPLRDYRPQRRWLALIGTGDRHAVASRGALYARGKLLWRWKEWIDRRFMNRFTAFRAPPAAGRTTGAPLALTDTERAQATAAIAKRRDGSGGDARRQIGASALARALTSVRPTAGRSDGTGTVRSPSGRAIQHIVGPIRAFIDDPWLFGRITANHALGGVYAMGGEAHTATALATVPPGLDRQTEETIFQMLAGAVSLLNETACALAGAQVGEGRELALGFTIGGLSDDDPRAARRKDGWRAGDVLLLTKPIGAGALLAAHARLRARGRWLDDALESMQRTDRAAAACLRAHGATACRHLNDLGLLGHLLEMSQTSGIGVEIDLSSLPVFDGAASAADLVEPPLADSALAMPPPVRRHPHYPLLFDPQTAGGLLAALPAATADACLNALHAGGDRHATRIGHVRPADDTPHAILLRP
jgi:selenide,water dikinase